MRRQRPCAGPSYASQPGGGWPTRSLTWAGRSLREILRGATMPRSGGCRRRRGHLFTDRVQLLRLSLSPPQHTGLAVTARSTRTAGAQLDGGCRGTAVADGSPAACGVATDCPEAWGRPGGTGRADGPPVMTDLKPRRGSGSGCVWGLVHDRRVPGSGCWSPSTRWRSQRVSAECRPSAVPSIDGRLGTASKAVTRLPAAPGGTWSGFESRLRVGG